MEAQMAALARYQISNFFQRNSPITEQQCIEMAEHVARESVARTPVQGGSSYTLSTGSYIIQFRNEDSPLNLDFFRYIEKAYAHFVPQHTSLGQLGPLHVYRMNNIGGVSMYARDALHSNDFRLLEETVRSFARFFASAWHNTPAEMARKDPQVLSKEYLSNLTQLINGLPARFRETLGYVISQLPMLFAEDWPQVPNHVELLENNIHVNPATGAITGICDWPEAEVGPFGMSLGGLETMLGINRLNKGFCYHSNQAHLRRLFHETLEESMGSISAENRERMRVATLAGLFLANGFGYDDDGNQVPAGEGSPDLAYLEVVLAHMEAPGSSSSH
ncbi:hypothetical protein F4778DRAFT_786535 [Xylariomycetidae sp. FL2044]|nr:hypothetical protein F4778DRAFT_786535 [Xylariomycetidae sp. FL2044]